MALTIPYLNVNIMHNAETVPLQQCDELRGAVVLAGLELAVPF